MNMIVGATLTGTAIPAFAAEPIDPIFAAIDAHRMACAEMSAAYEVHSHLDRTLPFSRCQSHITRWEEKIVETDDPRWIAAEREINRCQDAADDAACKLVSVTPVTLAGMIAMLGHVTEVEQKDPEAWPEPLCDDDDTEQKRGRNWSFYLHRNLLESLQALAA